MLFAIAAPLVISVAFSFVKWAGFGKMRFIGLANFARLVKDEVFGDRS